MKMSRRNFVEMMGAAGGAALLTAYARSGGEIALESALTEMLRRGKSVPGGACGF